MDDKKAIEIPLGAKDSELYKFEYTIPDGYEAEIKDGKVIVQKKESEDERIRKALIEAFKKKLEIGYEWVEYGIPNRSVLDWLEKQKDKVVKFDHDREQQPAEWSEEDKKMLKATLESLKRYQLSMPNYQVELQMRWLKSLRPQPSWKPSEEQMNHLEYAYTQLKLQKCYAPHVYETLGSLYDDLKKHFSL